MSIPNLNIVQQIQQRSGYQGDYAFLSTMKRGPNGERGKWTDLSFQYPPSGLHGTPWPLSEQPHEHDLFFSVLRFSEPLRSNDNVTEPGVLFADLDGVDPEGLIENMRPTVAWETSRGNYQGVWYLTGNLIGYKEWSSLNRRLTHWTKADPGGWQGSKVLRVPGTVNWKRRDFGSLLWHRPTRLFDARNLHAFLPELPPTLAVTYEPEDHPDLPTEAESTDLIRAAWGKISLRGRHMLMKDRVQDRSLHIVRVAHELLACDLYPSIVFEMIWNRPWNKWRTDRDQPHILWQEIVRARGEDL